MFLIVGGEGSSNRNASRDESVEAGDKSVEAGDESIEARDKTPQSCYNDHPKRGNNIHWNLNQDSSVFTQHNIFENGACNLRPLCFVLNMLTRLPLMPHIYASVNRVSIGSDNGLPPIRRQAFI